MKERKQRIKLTTPWLQQLSHQVAVLQVLSASNSAVIRVEGCITQLQAGCLYRVRLSWHPCTGETRSQGHQVNPRSTSRCVLTGAAVSVLLSLGGLLLGGLLLSGTQYSLPLQITRESIPHIGGANPCSALGHLPERYHAAPLEQALNLPQAFLPCEFL